MHLSTAARSQARQLVSRHITNYAFLYPRASFSSLSLEHPFPTVPSSVPSVRFTHDHSPTNASTLPKGLPNDPAVISAAKRPAHPYSSLDHDLFEDETEEYGYDVASASSASSSSNADNNAITATAQLAAAYPLAFYITPTRITSPSRPFVKAILRGDYDIAETIGRETQAAGFRIKPRFVHTRLALHVLRRELNRIAVPTSSALRSENAPDIDAFLHWWSLIPHSRYSTPNSNTGISEILPLLLQHSHYTKTYHALAQFALLAAAKGYAGKVAPSALSHIVQFASPQKSQEFIEDFERLAAEERNLVISGGFVERRWKWRNLVVRSYANGGHSDLAVERLRRMREIGKEDGVVVDKSTYKSVMENLARAKRPADVETVRELLRQDYGQDAELYTHDSVQHPGSTFRLPSSPSDAEMSTAIELLLDMHAKDLMPPKFLYTLVRHIYQHIDTPLSVSTSLPSTSPQTQPDSSIHPLAPLAQSLYNQIMDRNSPRWVPWLQAWTSAEMKYLLDTHRPADALEVFERNCQVMGVKKELIQWARGRTQERVLPATKTGKSRKTIFVLPKPIERESTSLGLASHPPDESSLSPEITMKKAWPNPPMMAMVYQALIRLARDLPTVHRIYASLLELADDAGASATLTPTSSSTSTPLAPTSSEPTYTLPSALHPHTALFQPILQSFARFGPDLSVRAHNLLTAIQDMQARGITPSIHNWGVVAKFFAWKGEWEKVIHVMDAVEAELEMELKAGIQNNGTLEQKIAQSPDKTLIAGSSSSESLRIFYTSILSTLVEKKKVVEAQEVERRLLANTSYNKKFETSSGVGINLKGASQTDIAVAKLGDAVQANEVKDVLNQMRKNRKVKVGYTYMRRK